MTTAHNAAAWVAKAESDIRGARNNVIAPDPAWDVVCFHAQQAAEKYLKALLVTYGEPVPRTHDLGALLGLCMQRAQGLSVLLGDCHVLEPYAVRIRYPDDLDMPDREEGLAAMEAVQRIREVVRRLL